ncbi:helix-turn-helix domain-containing protein [Thermaurantiacus sp.]
MTDPSLSLHYYPPSPALRGLISSYYVFNLGARQVRDILRAEVAQVRFVLRGHGYIAYGDNPFEPMPVTSLAGPSGSAIRFHAFGPFRLIGVGLLPAGWAALIGEEASRYADRLVDLSGLAPALVREALLQMQEARDHAGLCAAADRLFLALAERARTPPLWLTRPTDAWLVGSPSPDVNALVAALGMSNRQVERMVARVYGASPKYMARKYRTLQAAVRLGLRPDLGWQGAAGTAFYDQSHFIRDFRHFVGMTPGQFIAGGTPWLTRLTIAKRSCGAALPQLIRAS